MELIFIFQWILVYMNKFFYSKLVTFIKYYSSSFVLVLKMVVLSQSAASNFHQQKLECTGGGFHYKIHKHTHIINSLFQCKNYIEINV
jgi:hypothetical protein